MILIKNINYGIASRVGNVIYINQNLQKYPELHNAIILHEASHSSGWSFADFKLDMKNQEMKGHKIDFYKFILTNPRSFAQFLPILKYDGKWTFDLTLTIFYGVMFIMIGSLGLLL